MSTLKIFNIKNNEQLWKDTIILQRLKRMF